MTQSEKHSNSENKCNTEMLLSTQHNTTEVNKILNIENTTFYVLHLVLEHKKKKLKNSTAVY